MPSFTTYAALITLAFTSCASAFSTNRRSFIEKGFAASAAVVTSSKILPANAGDDFVAGGKIQFGAEDLMSPKAHGTSDQPVMGDLRYGVSNKLADKITNYNRHFAENGGYFVKTTFEDEVLAANGPITFYDSVTGKPLFKAPIGRTAEEFLNESEYHGWPSFRDQEVVWENVRVLKDGETVSTSGTHLGHNLPSKDRRNRYCINLVSVAGNPV
mmetsp:Transcript_22619/g.34480  ORF Transcript_22619/g.34480 Transcript_22619/m.34480 type:complete len:214 (-) Transcript_22619:99-740(-)